MAEGRAAIRASSRCARMRRALSVEHPSRKGHPAIVCLMEADDGFTMDGMLPA